ncbi:hypothetical protein CRG98_035855 [Punica granatum]|uniref:Uncharacterized protein n=1 Tax=Punica granatum TaxID=22663 RepID=A0A2I0IIB8_PUNGR|nr:hypothetical protein CRG98_035855 [Punica granatum]
MEESDAEFGFRSQRGSTALTSEQRRGEEERETERDREDSDWCDLIGLLCYESRRLEHCQWSPSTWLVKFRFPLAFRCRHEKYLSGTEGLPAVDRLTLRRRSHRGSSDDIPTPVPFVQDKCVLSLSNCDK